MQTKFSSTQDWLNFDREHLWHPYTSMADPLRCYPVVAAKGAYLELADGRQLLDGMSSWWCAIHGYQHPQLNQAVSEQLTKMSHVMFGGIAHRAAAELGARLIDLTPEPLQQVFFADSGSIAIEVAMKMALQYWQSRGQNEKCKLLSVRGGYHGDPFACMAVGDPVNGQHHLFKGVLAKQFFAERPRIRFEEDWQDEDIHSVRELLIAHHQDIAGVILEPVVQGAGGMRFYSPHYLTALREVCDEFDVLLIFDEIATGFGRTGKLFALEHAQVCPDILSVGKALTGGMMTLSATLSTPKISQEISSGSAPALMHGPTFMANPLACAVSCASIDVLLETGDAATYPKGWQPKIVEIEAALSGLDVLKDHPAVADVRVLGAIGVVEMKAAVDVAKVQAAMVERGVWLRPFGNLIYMMPAYILTPDEQRLLVQSVVDMVKTLYPE